MLKALCSSKAKAAKAEINNKKAYGVNLSATKGQSAPFMEVIYENRYTS